LVPIPLIARGDHSRDFPQLDVLEAREQFLPHAYDEELPGLGPTRVVELTLLRNQAQAQRHKDHAGEQNRDQEQEGLPSRKARPAGRLHAVSLSPWRAG
jgi:hypothetical protein